MPFRFHDTLTGETRDFEPQEAGVVRMYNCGPTVYSSPQIGNYRAWTFVDVLRRSLELGGFRVRQIMNLTDVGHLTLDDIESGEDKMEAAARLEGKTAWEIADHYIAEFHAAVERLNFLPAERYPRATDHIAEMIVMIEALVASKHAYVTESGNVYYDVFSFPAYGRLSGNKLDELDAGSRVAVLDEKRHHADFALWKRDEKHQMQWDSPWGRGFPGWHIECSAMGRKYLGDEIDIHTGGEDNIFPHHECEIAQNEGFSDRPFVRFWMHNRHLLVDGKKMSKSGGTAYSFDDVIDRGHSARALRYLLLSTHYRLPMNFTWQALEGAASAVAGLDTAVGHMTVDDSAADDPAVALTIARVDGAFLAALEDDLNVSVALAAVHELRSFTNKHGALSPGDHERLRGMWDRFDAVLGLDLLATADAEPEAQDDDAEIQALVDEREAARAARDWARGDQIRDELTARGIKLEDGPDGVRWSRS